MKLTIFTVIVGLSWVVAYPLSENEGTEWWRTALFYQIYPRSFQDTDRNGVGDLNGITTRLQHLKNLGIKATWISPINTSPQVDAGYDISNFTDIDPLFGSMDDYLFLIQEANRLGIKVIMDFVPNHSSNKHEWFEKSVQFEEPYIDYFVWKDHILVEGNYQKPNNWISGMSHDSAWMWEGRRKQYYYHQYAPEQPDLNYRNPALVQEMKDILTFWLDKGVDGFRVDAVNHLFEHESFADEPKTNDPNCGPTDPCSLEHIYTTDQPETLDMVIQWRQVLNEHSKKTGKEYVLMTETWSPMDVLMDYYGNSTHDGASFPFNFDLLNLNGNSKAIEYKNVIDNWMNRVPKGRTVNWVLGSHDKPRLASRVGKERSDALIMMTLTLPGVAITYNGEEIVMEDTFITWEQTQDPTAINAGEEEYLKYTRDPQRTPMQWSAEKNAGFSLANSTWLPVNPNYETVNVEKEKYGGHTHYSVYKDLVALRELDTLKKGDLKTEVLEEDVMVVVRSREGLPTFVTVCNFDKSIKTVNLLDVAVLPAQLKVAIASVGSQIDSGALVATSKLILNPFESYVLTDDLQY